MPLTSPKALALLALATVAALAAPARAELKADELLLVVNGNSPDSIRIAQFYANARLVPDGRICKLDLPAGEEIPFETYERNVVPVVRKFLRDNRLERQVRCLVLFYGTPLRISPVKIGPDERREIDALRTELVATEQRLVTEIGDYELFVRRLVPDFAPPPPPAFPPAPAAGNAVGNAAGSQQIVARFDRCNAALFTRLRNADLDEQTKAVARLRSTFRLLHGEENYIRALLPGELADPRTPQPVKDAAPALIAGVQEARRATEAALDRRFDPTERARVRDLTAKHFGLLTYAEVLRGQLGYFGNEQSGAALDSELPLLWVPFYERANSLPNPGYFQVPPAPATRILMTARIDGPDEQVPLNLILASIKAERDGLKGTIAIDSRGLQLDATRPAQNGYATYDQTLRNLAALLRAKTSLQVVFDEREPVFAPHTVKNVAVYCGWYSVGNYVPGCSFVPGAVGYHVASFEMKTLRDPQNGGWVRGLLKDNVAATLGPVAEPYLIAFPDADQFFPVLMTGKLSLAETYWSTQKLLSWQMGLVGDPLYRPYATNPPLTPADLPPDLQKAFLPRPAFSPPSAPSSAPPIAPPSAPPGTPPSAPPGAPVPDTDSPSTSPSTQPAPPPDR